MARKPTSASAKRSPGIRKTAASPQLSATDSLVNVVTGMGTERDKSLATMFRFESMDQAQLDSAYRGDWIARKIVDIPADDATREWRAWQAEKQDITAIETLERTIGLQKRLKQAMLRGRLYGGGAIVLGVNQGTMADELRVDRIRKGDLKWINVVSRYDLGTGPIDWRVDSPYYGQPQYYTRTGTGLSSLQIHPSRVIRFLGNEVLDLKLANGWGDSVLQVVADAVLAAGTVTNVTAQLVQEAKTDVVQIPEMSERIKNKDYEDRLRKRFALANMMRSAYSILLIDKEEQWNRQQTSFAGLPDVLRMYLMIASGAADIPATRMLGQSPTGMSATGESDIRNYYDRVSDEQNNEVTPNITSLDEILIRSALGSRPADVFYEWNSLWQMTEKEKMEIEKSKADVFKIDVDSGLIDPVVLKEARENQLIESGLYPGLEQTLEEYAGQFDDIDQYVQPSQPDADPAAIEGAKARQIAGDRATIDDTRPRSLYVRRDVLNAREIIAWAKSQGFKSTLAESDMHVTVAFSRSEVDWMKVGQTWSPGEDGTLTVAPGGPRQVEQFGGGAVVLAFQSSDLQWRHEQIRDAGASWDFPEYSPHITITYDPGDVDLESVTPYRGKIELGPEIFEEINEDWKSGVVEK